jgi:signal transduction histidine kinase
VTTAATAAEVELDPFPKAPVVPFPVESATPAITSIVNLLVVAGVPSILVGADRSVKFVSDDAKKLFDATQSDLSSVKAIETRVGVRIGELSVPATAGLRIRNTNVLYSLVPISGGASGAVLVFRYADAKANAPFVTYVRETVLGPLRSLRDSLLAASRERTTREPILTDAAATIEQVLSSLELAPEVGDPQQDSRKAPTVTDVVHSVADRFRTFGDLKGVQMTVDVQELEERFRDSEQLRDALSILMDNALHYVPAGGQVVIGVRWMEHKNKPLLLFFVMDNGALVPEQLRQSIFEPDFVWNPQSPERTGRSLFKAREFAVAHSGSVWVESKTGKACTFFLRVRPDSVS